MMKTFSKKTVRTAIIIILSLLAVVSVVQGIANAIEFSQDFQWDAARAIVEKIDPYEMSLDSGVVVNSSALDEFYRLFTDKGLEQKMEANQFPSLLLMLAPYTLLSPFAARIAWIISNIIFTALIIVLLRKTFLENVDIYEFAVLILLMLAGTPYRNQLGVGQHTLFSFCFFLLAVWLDKKKPEGNRIIVALCMFVSYFKYTLTAPITLYMLYRRRFREFFISVAGHIFVTIALALYMGKSVSYMIIAPLKVSSVLSAQGGIDLGALLGGGLPYLAVAGCIAIGLFVLTLIMPKGKEYILFPLLLLWSLILTYHRTYDFFVLSSIYVLFDKAYMEDFSPRLGQIMKNCYWILLFVIYFGLRLFHESLPSRIGAGVVYYAFTAIVTFLCVRLVISERAHQ